MRELNGGCHSVIGVYSEIKDNDLNLRMHFVTGCTKQYSYDYLRRIHHKTHHK